MGSLKAVNFSSSSAFFVCLALFALLGASNAAGITLLSFGRTNVTMGRQVSVPRTTPQCALWEEKKAYYAMWRSSPTEIGSVGYEYNDTAIWISHPPRSFVHSWAPLSGFKLIAWRGGGLLVGCWSIGFAVMAEDFSTFWTTPLDNCVSCQVQESTGLLWVELRSAEHGPMLTAYNLSTVSATQIGQTVGSPWPMGNMCAQSNSPGITIYDEIMVVLCQSRPLYLDLLNPDMLRYFGPSGASDALPVINSTLWYFPAPYGVERWTIANRLQPAFLASSASGYSNPTIVYAFNPASETVYWAKNEGIFAPVTVKISQLGSSASAFLDPAPPEVSLAIPGSSYRHLSVDWQSNRIVLLYDEPYSGTHAGSNIAYYSFGNCRAQATNCSDCISDGDLECGWCATGATSGNCVPAKSCQTRWFQDVCPMLNSVVSLGDLVTGLPFVLQLDATLFAGYNVSCQLRHESSAQIVPLSVIPAAVPLCGLTTASDPVLQRISGGYYVDLFLDGYITYPDSQPVRFTNCSSFSSCRSCTLASDSCDWCVYDGLCVNSATSCSVSGPASLRPTTPIACPVQLAVTPQASILPLPPGALVTIQATSLITPSLTMAALYGCRFELEDNARLSATGAFLSSTVGVQCAIPAPATGYVGAANVSLTLNGHDFADNANHFVFYDCSSPTFSSCDRCLAAENALCGWNTATSSCGLASSCSAGSDCRSTCPSVTGLNLTSFHVADDVGAYVAITGTYFTGTSPTTWSCDFQGVGTTAGIRQSETVVVCPVPTFTDGSYFTTTRTIYKTSLNIIHNSAPYVAPIPVNWYACGGLNCSTCLNDDGATSLSPKCRWDFNGYQCGLLTAAQLSECPRILTMSDTFGHNSGGLSLEITPKTAPTAPLDALTFTCAWTHMSHGVADISGPATLSGGKWHCTTPDISALTLATLVTSKFSIQANSAGAGGNVDFTSNPIDFTFIDCSLSTSCGSCLRSSQCSWVNYTRCTSSVGAYDVDPIQGECPVLLSMTPVLQAVTAKVNVTVSVAHFPSVDWASKYHCRWITPLGALIKTNIVSYNATTLTCPFSRTYHDLYTAMLKFDIALDDGLALTTDQLDYEVYDCTQGTNCGLCSQIHPMCGWCPDIAACLDNATCAVRSPSSDWARDFCPYIDAINPPFTALGRASVVTFTGQFYSVSNLDMKCRFKYEDGSFDLVTANATSTAIACLLPSIVSESSISIEVGQMLNLRRRVPTFVSYTGDIFSFDFINCAPPSNESSCGECTGAGLDARCGWCAYDAICADPYSCYTNYSTHFTTVDSCPQMISLTPAVGPLSGGTKVMVTGSFFLQGPPGTSCRFGSQVVPATVETQTSLSCTSPSAASVGVSKSGKTVDVDILWEDGLFTRSAGFKFTYKDNDHTTAIVLGVVLGVVGLIILVVIILFIIFYKKIREKRDQRRFLKLREPEYAVVAFAQTKGIEMVLTPSDLKALASFIRALEADTNFSIIQGLAASSPSSQSDYLARSAIYFYQSRGRALDLLMTFVSAEVKASEHEGTLFRASSFACKLFNQYARYLGLPYLWHTLGFYVNQLAEFAKEERTEERDDILGPGSMEVDPDRFDDEAMAPSEFDIRLNQYELITRASKFLKSIFGSLPYMRPEFRQLCAHVKSEVANKFGTDTNADYKAVGGFIFLRFICPSIMAPHVYGLVTTPPNETAQRYFVLLAKSLQNLANQTLPGTNEDFMARMNEFITKNIDPLHMWVDDLCNGAAMASPSEQELDIPENLVNSSVSVMQQTLVEEWDHVVKYLSESQIEELERVKEKGPIGKKPKGKNSAPPRKAR